jgi:hypothetical protein
MLRDHCSLSAAALQYAYVNPAFAIASIALAIEPSALMMVATADLIAAFCICVGIVMIFILALCRTGIARLDILSHTFEYCQFWWHYLNNCLTK